MVTIVLARHTATDDSGVRLSGRTPGVHLNETGRQQARWLAQRLLAYSPTAIVSSPLERACETAMPLAALTDAPIHQHAGLIEIDFGGWQGQTFSALDDDPDWRVFNTAPERARLPGRESLADVAARAVAALSQIAAERVGDVVVAFSHADVIRLLLTSVLETPIQTFRRCDVGHGSFFEFSVGRGRIVLTDHEDLTVGVSPSTPR